ncbi:MAG TPA: hypothetical protein VH912_31700 [Streptosporangiaceae bacterium]|jgi:hypothetical protein
MRAEPTQTAERTSWHGPADGLDGRPFLRANAVTLVAAVIAAALAGIVWFGMPHEREIDSLPVFLFKLTPFAAASVAIAWLDLGWARRLRLPQVLIPISFLAMFCVFVPRIFYYRRDPGPEHYYTVLTLVPLIILALVLAYRLGGGSRSTALRLAAALLVLQLSGLEDLAYLTVNPHPDPWWSSLPPVWDWAYHIKVFLGHFPSKNEALAFIGVHVAIAVVILFLPGRVIRGVTAHLRGWRRERVA